MSKIQGKYSESEESEESESEAESEFDIELEEYRLTQTVFDFSENFNDYCDNNYLSIGENLRHNDIYNYLIDILEKK